MISLALDVGDRRVGLALSDETGTLARPYGVYYRQGDEADVGELATLAQAVEAEVLVVGVPLNMDGTAGEQAGKAETFGRSVAEQAGVPVELVDERLTTVEAERVLQESGLNGRKRRLVQDALAAVLILQAWLDGRREE
ncbi:MAG: Holliday junction resolvase RuvX [Candidatus Bipolaricaulota bacterium]